MEDELKELGLFRYTVTALSEGRIPKEYICTNSYQRVLDHVNSQSKVAIYGPKGVGKSCGLLAIWISLLKQNIPCIYTTVSAIRSWHRASVQKYAELLMHNFLPDCKENIGSQTNYCDMLESLLTSNSNMKLLLDFCNFDEKSLDVVTNLSGCISIAKSAIIAVSSGAGSFITDRIVESRLQSLLNDYSRIDMYPFHQNEANYLLKNCMFSYEELKPFTGRNPLLLCHASTCHSIHEARAKVQDRVVKFISNHWKKSCELHEQYLQSLEDTKHLLHAATKKIPVDSQIYYPSFIYKQTICFITKIERCIETNKELLQIRLNFPLLPEVIKKDLRAEQKQSPVDLCKYPAVRGYLLEEAFFNSSENCFYNLDINTCNDTTITALQLTVESRTYCDDVIKDMRKGVLYKLRMGHPFIDGVGILKDQNGKYWFVYIQLSVSTYADHSVNIVKILTTPKGQSKELKNSKLNSFHEYYKTLAEKFNIEDTIYFYVSTGTVCSGLQKTYKLMEEHANKVFKVGIISNTSTMYRTLINLGC